MKTGTPFILCICTLLLSCKKDKDEEVQPDPTPTASYNYINSLSAPYKFKSGTYWVYENDSTLVLDSVTVDSISTGYFVATPSVHGTTGQSQTEFYKMYLHHHGTSQSYNQTLMKTSLVREYSGDWSNFSGQTVYTVNSPVGTYPNGMSILAKFASLNVNANTFALVDEIKITAASQSTPVFTYDTHLYYCDSVGLVKKETELSPVNIESWSLKRWNIVR